VDPRTVATCVVCAVYPVSGGGNLVLAHEGQVFFMAACKEHMKALASGIDTITAEMAAEMTAEPENRPHPHRGSGFFALTSLEGKEDRKSHIICGHCFQGFCIRMAVLVAQINPKRVPTELTSFIGTFNEWSDQHDDQSNDQNRKRPPPKALPDGG
jgi:hypothetical protein